MGLLELQRQLKPLSQHWHKIGVAVNIGSLGTINRLHGRDPERCLHSVCCEWLVMERGLAWERVVAVLRALSVGALSVGAQVEEVAGEIEKRFCQDSDSTADKSLTMVRRTNYN